MADVNDDGSGGGHDPYAAFRVPAFRRYLAGYTLLRIGTAGQTIAILWEVSERTGSAWGLTWVALAQAVPMLVLTLPAGVLADRVDRRRLMVVGLLGASVTSVLLGVQSLLGASVLWMYATLFLDACVLRMIWPARAALLPRLVPAEAFANAVTWRSSLTQVARLAGPAAGGVIIWLSVPAAYLVAAGSSLLFALLMAGLKADTSPPPPQPGAARGFGSAVADVREGLAFVWRRKVVLGAVSLDLFAVLFGGATYLLPIIAKDRLGVGEVGFGLLNAAPAAGAAATALVLAWLPPMRRAGRTMLWAVAGFGLATVVFGLSTSFALSLGMLLLTGAFDNVSVVVRQTLIQLATPDAMRGRVSAVSAIFIGSSNELGGVESTAVAGLFGPVVSVVSGGVGTLLVVATWAGLFPELRRLGSLESAQDGPAR